MPPSLDREVVVKLRNVCKSYDDGQTFAVNDVSLDIHRGEALVLLGSSGSGKSTVLKTINRLVYPTSGDVIIRGSNTREVSTVELRRSIGYVAQGIALFPFMPVWENLALPLRLRKIGKAERRLRALEAMTWVNLSPELADRMPQQLSGGQQQRVGVARALLAGADLLLMDEPFGALDAVTREALQEEVVRLKTERKVTILFVTHDLFEALTIADRIGIMHNGSLEQIGYPQDVMAAPATDFVRKLFEKPMQQLQILGSQA